jgi:precorrin-6B methylase 2
MLSLLNEISTGANTSAFGNTQETTPNVDATYGEITEHGVSMILSKIDIRPDDVFLDLGSGTGRVVLQVFLEKNIESLGIEFIKKRYMMAEESLLKLKEKIDNPKVHFVNGDFFTVNWSDATIIIMCNTCFTEDVMDKIITRLPTCKKLRYVIMLKQLEKKPDYLDVFESFNVPVTWTSETNVTIYKVNTDKIKRDKKSSRKPAIRKSRKKI